MFMHSTANHWHGMWVNQFSFSKGGLCFHFVVTANNLTLSDCSVVNKLFGNAHFTSISLSSKSHSESLSVLE